MKAELLDHQKFLRLKRLLGQPVPHIIGYLTLMWRRGYQTGNPVLGDELDVESAAEFVGEPGKFASAVIEAGFVDRLASGKLAIHDLYDHAPKYAQLRMARKGTAPKGKLPSHSRDGSGEGKDDLGEPHGSHEPENGSHEPKGEEDRFGRAPKVRDKRLKLKTSKDSSELATQTPEPTPPDSILTFPAVGKGPKVWHLTQRQVDDWATAFPGIDILAECRHARAWVDAKPKRKKTHQGMPSFLVGWFGRATDSGRSHSGEGKQAGPSTSTFVPDQILPTADDPKPIKRGPPVQLPGKPKAEPQPQVQETPQPPHQEPR